MPAIVASWKWNGPCCAFACEAGTVTVAERPMKCRNFRMTTPPGGSNARPMYVPDGTHRPTRVDSQGARLSGESALPLKREIGPPRAFSDEATPLDGECGRGKA